MRKVDIIESIEVFKQSFFRIVSTRLRHEKFDGTMSDEMIRMSFERSDAVVVLMHNVSTDTLVMVELFRYPTYDKTHNGWLVELPAGVVEDGEQPEDTMRREVIEETGYHIQELRHVQTFFASPGGSSERMFLYYSQVKPKQKLSEGGGLESEHEYVRTFDLPVDEVLKMLDTGDFMDAKTLVGLQWLALHRHHLSG